MLHYDQNARRLAADEHVARLARVAAAPRNERRAQPHAAPQVRARRLAVDAQPGR